MPYNILLIQCRLYDDFGQIARNPLNSLTLKLNQFSFGLVVGLVRRFRCAFVLIACNKKQFIQHFTKLSGDLSRGADFVTPHLSGLILTL